MSSADTQIAPSEMQCPRCQSDDVKRSRRRMWERVALFALRGQVHRCRDCKKRFWVGIKWTPFILGSLVTLLVIGIISGMIVAHNSRVTAASAAPVRRYPRAKNIRPLPEGVPGLANRSAAPAK